MFEQIDPPESEEKCYRVTVELSAVAEVIIWSENETKARESVLSNVYEEIEILNKEVEDILEIKEIEE